MQQTSLITAFKEVQEQPDVYRAAPTVTADEILAQARKILVTRHAPGQTLNSPCETREYLMHALAGLEHEVFAAIFLDNRHRILAFEILFQGTLNSTAVYPREVVKRALAHNAAAIVYAHNHPSGVAEPSRADELLTQRLKEALGLVDVRTIDHIVVGAGETVSFAERGLI